MRITQTTRAPDPLFQIHSRMPRVSAKLSQSKQDISVFHPKAISCYRRHQTSMLHLPKDKYALTDGLQKALSRTSGIVQSFR